MFLSQRGIQMLSLDAESKTGCVIASKTKMVRVAWKLERSILCQRFPYELSGDKARNRRASGIRLSLTRVSGMAFVFRDIDLMCIRESILQLKL